MKKINLQNEFSSVKGRKSLNNSYHLHQSGIVKNMFLKQKRKYIITIIIIVSIY